MSRKLSSVFLGFVAIAAFFHFSFSLFAAEGAPKELRVLSYNIHIGIGMDKKLDLERTAKVILEQNPDLVALQEVDRLADRTNKVDQVAELEKLTKMKCVYGKTLDRSNGEYGIAILSKFPVLQQKFTQLPRHEKEEDRGLLQVLVQVDEKTQVVFACTHFCHIHENRRVKQAEKINEVFAETDSIAIIAGDFNAEPESESIAKLNAFWTDATDKTPTFSSTNPKNKIDYIFYRPKGALKVKETKVIEDKITSDHRPVLTVFHWNSQP